MRPFTFCTLTLVLPLLFISCDPCNYVDCATDNYHGQFRIVSAVTGKDLVFGPYAAYDKNQIKFYTLKGADTVFFDYQPIRFANTGYDSILYVYFYPRPDVAYMRLGNGDIDTLAISYKTSPGGKCCGPITEIATFRYNNAVDIPGDLGTQELGK